MRKQLSHGLQLAVAYSWNRAFVSIPVFLNTAPYLTWQMSPNIDYHPQRLVLNYTWNLPLGHAAGFLGKVLDGWSWSGVTFIQDGTPLAIYDSQAGTVFFGSGAPGNPFAQICPGMTSSNVATSGPITSRLGMPFSANAYVNPAAFCPLPVLGASGATGIGNYGQGTILSPGQNNWDMSLAKSTKVGGLREDATLVFRVEFYNTFNHPQFEFSTVSDSALANMDASSATFGNITTSAVNPRLIQLALKYLF